jgi:hypothetical protein
MTGDDRFTCATCDVTIDHHPVFHLGLAFCCAGCAADGPCMCSYDLPVAPVVAPADRATAVAPVDAVGPLVEPPLPPAAPTRAIPQPASPHPAARPLVDSGAPAMAGVARR